MNDGSSTLHVKITGPVADIHKLSSWVFFFFPFLFAIKHTVLTMHNRSLRSASNLSTPIKKKYWIQDHKQRVSYSTSVQSWRVEFQEDLHWENPQSNKKRQAETCPHSK